jgi:hypothetical protein
MHTEATLAGRRHGEELSYVTEHFRDLQGMRVAPFPAAFLLLIGVATSIRLSRWHIADLTVLILVLFFAVWQPWSKAWYKRHYGFVEISPRQPSAPGLHWAMLALLAVWAGTMVFRSLDPYRSSVNMLCFLFFVLPKCFYPASVSILIRLRRALYITSALVILAIIWRTVAIRYTIGRAPFPDSSKWLALTGILATILLLSLYDHWLLHHLLINPRREPSHD